MGKYAIANDPVFKRQQGKGDGSMDMYMVETTVADVDAGTYTIAVCVQRRDGKRLSADELTALEQVFPIRKPAKKRPTAKRKTATAKRKAAKRA